MLPIWSPPPELSRPAPRSVRRRAGRGWFLTFVHLVILPHTLIGLGLLIFVLGQLTLLIFGATQTATIEGKTLKSNRKSTTYTLAYRYGSPSKNATADVTRSEFERLKQGEKFPIKIWRFSDENNFAWRLPLLENGWPGWTFYAPFGFCAFWNTVVFVFQWGLTIYPLITRNLVRKGVATRGQITKIQRVKNGQVISYTWKDKDEHPRQSRMPIERKFDLPAVGAQVTVLYFPNRPRLNTAYEICDYEVAAN